MFLLAVQLKIFHCHLSMKKMAVANSSQAYFQKQQSIRQNTETAWIYPSESFAFDGCIQALGVFMEVFGSKNYLVMVILCIRPPVRGFTM